ncbi:hypothetical protein Nepgr_032666 [Nepenthes gracilis]|uniref:Fe2OG dioxygenase domain-containing protein n=1 Tax=Nepenthes gracilis TaxID=150966 RepID=A0AAD3Y688_NEPGR|nr:hypothetical protein Nepgr_032666 [Nepenthes gracilis]
MEKLVSSWFTIKTLPENYVFPAGKRPGKLHAPVSKAIPVVDLEKACGLHGRLDIIQQIMEACEDHGFFQVINHGVQATLMEDAMAVFKEFFELPGEEKSRLFSEDNSQSCRLYTSTVNYRKEEIHFWRDALTHPCRPLAECVQHWPEKPNRYREVIGALCEEVNELGSRILKLICEGLELEKGYLENELSKETSLTVNHYPPCPDPSLTLGLSKHCDPNLITLLIQGDVPGLQVLKDDEWIGVEPLPHAFVVNVGYLLHIISNGKLKGAMHRAVTNAKTTRTSAAFFINAAENSIVQPAKALVGAENPPLYKAFRYGEFFKTYASHSGDTEIVLEPYKMKY